MEPRHKLQFDERRGTYAVWLRRQGVRRCFSLGRNKRKAQKALKQLERDIESGKIVFAEQETSRSIQGNGAPDIRIEELVFEYLKWAESNLAKSTCGTRKLYLMDFYSFVGECMVSAITPLILSSYRGATRQRIIKERKERMAKRPDCKDEVFTSENAGNTHLRHVKTLLKWGEDMRLCKCSFDKFPPITESPTRSMAPKAEDVERLLARMPEDMRDMTLLEVLTGLRPQELRCLKKDDVHQENGQMFLVLKPKSEELMRQPKPRVVALSQTAVDIIAKAMQRNPDSSVLFLNEDGNPYTAGTYRQRFQRWCRRAGIRKMPPYAVRHFYGTHHAGIGTNNQVLSQLMGHTTTRTLARYVEPVPEYQQKAVEAHETSLAKLLKIGLGGDKLETK